MLADARTILMTADAVGGVFTYAVELAKGLRPYNVRVVLATMGSRPSRCQVRELNAIGNVELEVGDYRLEWMPDAWTDVDRAGDWLLALEQRFRPDIVHLNGYAHGDLPFRAPKIVVAHSCVLSWWEAVKGVAAPREWEEYRRRVRKGIHAADLLIAPTSALLHRIQALYGPTHHCRVIPNGRNPEPLRAGRKLPYVFTAGRLWDEAKNVSLLRGIADRLPWPVYAAGEGDGGRGGNFRPLGRLTAATVWAWLSGASIYALPALYEPFGLSVLEAALSGAALVLGDIESLRENWDGAAILVDPRDPEAWEGEIRCLSANPERLRRLRRAAKMRAARFPSSAMADRYVRAYRAVQQGRLACAS